MAGDHIESVKHGINAFHSNLMGDPSVVEQAPTSVARILVFQLVGANLNAHLANFIDFSE